MQNCSSSKELPLKNVKLAEGFWPRYQKLVREEVIPYQWKALNDQVEDAEPSHAIQNFRIAAGLEEGEFGGLFFQDSDLAKWLEAVGYSLESNPDPNLEAQADEVIDLIEKAQGPDGYVNTYFTLKEPSKRWTNLLECHELYCAGHLIEAAVAYFRGTGKRQLLDVMCRYADYIDSVFGKETGKLRGYCGHEEVELALLKLYDTTGCERYFKLAEYFINERGQEPNYLRMEFEKRGGISAWSNTVQHSPDLQYMQAHLPVREQTDAVGHAVRAVYLYTGMAELAAKTGDEKLIEACRRLFDSIAQKQMYITGGIGSTNHGEAFTLDYDLPNDTIYQETCASVGLVFFAHSMLKLEANGVYADVMERALYNSVLSGMALDGKSFFYVNPLEVWPDACGKNPSRAHVKPVRQKWYGCACCPPNIARLLSSLGRYVYTVSGNRIYAHLYMGSDAVIELENGRVRLVQETDYPWQGTVRIKILENGESNFTLALRIPGWCKNAEISVNQKAQHANRMNGYALIERSWQKGDTVELRLDMPAELIEANPHVRADAGKVAIQRGPVVYCLEEEDNGKNLSALALAPDTVLAAEFDRELLGGTVVISGTAVRTDMDGWENTLYRTYSGNIKVQQIKAVPYCLWGNRKPGEMLVWIRKM